MASKTTAVRLQAAQTILNNAGKLSDRLTKDEKSARTENMTFAQLLDGIL